MFHFVPNTGGCSADRAATPKCGVPGRGGDPGATRLYVI